MDASSGGLSGIEHDDGYQRALESTNIFTTLSPVLLGNALSKTFSKVVNWH